MSYMRPRFLQPSSSPSITGLVDGPSYRFRLERVRSVRKHGEQVAQQELAGALGRRDDCAAELADADAVAGGARDAQIAATRRPLSAQDLQSHQAWIERTEQARTAVAESLTRHQREVERRQAALTRAAREKKVLDRLDARRRREFEREAARREAGVTDEIALNVFRAKSA
jgi:flagellar export protein FliJ